MAALNLEEFLTQFIGKRDIKIFMTFWMGNLTTKRSETLTCITSYCALHWDFFLQVPEIKECIPQKGGQGCLYWLRFYFLLCKRGETVGEGVGVKQLQSIHLIKSRWEAQNRHPVQKWLNKPSTKETTCKILVWLLAACFSVVSTQKPLKIWTFSLERGKKNKVNIVTWCFNLKPMLYTDTNFNQL